MGIVRMGLPYDLVILLRDTFKIKKFIETGTFRGQTAEWASANFNQVETIEFAEKLYKEALNKFKQKVNINFRFGDSRLELNKIVQYLDEQVIFWLDAHWCSMGSYGEEDQCPLLKELDVINSSNQDHILLIDDARLFLAPPPHPNSVKYYPGIQEVISAISNKYEKSIFIFEDVIIAVPKNNSQFVVDFLQNKTTIEWKKYKEGLNRDSYLNRREKLQKTKELLHSILHIWKI